MERIFPELTAECERTAIMYCSGLEKKEIADIKCRATSCNYISGASFRASYYI